MEEVKRGKKKKKRRKLAFDENGSYPNHFATRGSISTMLTPGSENKRSPVHFILPMRPTAVFRPCESVCEESDSIGPSVHTRFSGVLKGWLTHYRRRNIP